MKLLTNTITALTMALALAVQLIAASPLPETQHQQLSRAEHESKLVQRPDPGTFAHSTSVHRTAYIFVGPRHTQGDKGASAELPEVERHVGVGVGNPQSLDRAGSTGHGKTAARSGTDLHTDDSSHSVTRRNHELPAKPQSAALTGHDYEGPRKPVSAIPTFTKPTRNHVKRRGFADVEDDGFAERALASAEFEEVLDRSSECSACVT